MTLKDSENYLRYRDEFLPVLNRFGGEVVAFDDSAPVLEGHLDPGRTVILRFPDKGTVMEWYTSEEYQRISEFRRAGVNQQFIVVLGERPEVDQFS